MKKTTVIALLCLLCSISCAKSQEVTKGLQAVKSEQAQIETININLEQSIINWKGSMLLVLADTMAQ